MTAGLTVERSGAVATVVLDRAAKHNAITLEMYRGLPGILRALDDDRDTKAVVVRGAGEKAFAAGADISEFREVRGNAASARSYNAAVAAAEQALEDLSKPTIAMIHGHCVGGGCGLALACDLRFADERARFAITPAKLGLVYGLESTRRLVDLVGPARAKWMLMSGLPVTAERARELGLADEVTDPGALADTTYDFARLLTTRAQYTVRATKTIVHRVLAGQRAEDAEMERLRDSSFDTGDYAEGVAAFLDKRDPVFTWS